MFAWTFLKKIANSSYALLTAFIPIIGWFLVADNTLASIASKYFQSPALAQPSWRIYAFHAGLTLVSISIILFYAACPSVIKIYEDFNDFALRNASTITESQVTSYINEMTSKGINIIFNSNTESISSLKTEITGRDIWYRRNQAELLRIQYEYFNFKDKRYLPGRLAVIAIGAPGLALAITPTVQTAFLSLKHVVQSIAIL